MVTGAPRSKLVTVDETVLLPVPTPCSRRRGCRGRPARPGDVGIGDLLPASADDERLVPLVVLEGDNAVTDWFARGRTRKTLRPRPQEPSGLPAPGRSRVLSGYGRDDTAERWYESDHGPRTPLSRAAPANCVSCGFFVPLSGGLGRLFGACGNAFAPDDGRVMGWWRRTAASSPSAAPLSTAPNPR